MKLKEILENRRDLLKISLSSNKIESIKVDLFDELYFSVEDGDLSEHIEIQAGMMAWWGTMLVMAEGELERLEEEYDMWYTPIYEREFNQLWAKLGYKKTNKPNISSVENAVKIKEENVYRDWRRKLRGNKTKVSILKSVSKWWEEKGKMLLTAARIMTTEMSTMDYYRERVKEDKEKWDVQKLQEMMEDEK